MKNAFLEREVTSLVDTKNRKGKAASVFKLRDKVLGNVKSPQDKVVLTDPETKKK